MLATDIGEVLKNRRKELRITQGHLAELSGISINTLYKIERGQANPSLDILSKLTEVMGLEVKIEPRKVE